MFQVNLCLSKREKKTWSYEWFGTKTRFDTEATQKGPIKKFSTGSRWKFSIVIPFLLPNFNPIRAKFHIFAGIAIYSYCCKPFLLSNKHFGTSTRFRCNEVLFHAGTKNIARYTEDFVRSRLQCATQSNHQLSEGCNVDVFSSWLQSRWNRWQFSPDTSGIPSSLGSGNTRVTPTLVPTHSKPSSAAKAVA